MLVAKIIDKEGVEFGENIMKKSKVMQETNKLNAQQTAGLMTHTRTSNLV